ncbi:MAG: hypothetical protein HUU19_14890 [Phycisphaerales bacterium]|nr:hypothetical protein [Planctomycetia bacterium]NUQ53967.1 hypothetical protein [Phycisphaerales bacterium]
MRHRSAIAVVVVGSAAAAMVVQSTWPRPTAMPAVLATAADRVLVDKSDSLFQRPPPTISEPLVAGERAFIKRVSGTRVGAPLPGAPR